jgi:hypothetical protein
MSTVRTDNFGPSAGGTTYSARGIAKAWVNFDGTGTIAARDSENVSSLTDNGTGDYTVNFSNAFANTNYNYAGGCGSADMGSVDAITIRFNSSASASSQQIRTLFTGASGNAYGDFAAATYISNGDLA